MRVCVLYDEGCSLEEFLSQYPCEWELQVLRRPVRDRIRQLAESGNYDVYFNLCDGPLEGNTPGLDLVQALEEFNLPFTGAYSHCYDPSREEMQAKATAHGIGFAKGFHIEAGENVLECVKDLCYPIMVKHPKSFSSIQMFRESRCDTPDQVENQFERVSQAFGAARVEEFIVGREFNVLVV